MLVEVKINDGEAVTTTRIISLAMLCVRSDWRRIAINEARNGILWCITKIIPWKGVGVEVKSLFVRVVAERNTEGDICKKKLITFDPPIQCLNVRQEDGRKGMTDLISKADELAEEIAGGLIDFLKNNGTVLEYLEDGNLKIWLVKDVDEVPDYVLSNKRQY